ncbi:MAG: polymer-forming cytoskeletal protein [Lachnospiraceae bacterium]|nr:polymer-forming cytoskeletal protein [Lachnospiraceae bacterium]
MAKEVIKISTLIAAGSVSEGDFKCPGSARIDGCINGNVEVDGMLILGAVGKINGNILAKSVQIGGEVVGDIVSPEKAELTNTAKVIGNLTTNVIVIDENAVFQGAVNMNQETPARTHGFAFKKVVKEDKKTAAMAVSEALKEAEKDNEDIDTEQV